MEPSTSIGARFESLVVIGYSKGKYGLRLCKCDCGRTCTADAYDLRNGLKVDCGRVKGHRARKVTTPKPVKDFKGQLRGFLRVLGLAMRGPHKQSRWLVLCERCHWFKVVDHSTLLAAGTETSCGCLKVERTRQRMTRHGMTGTPTWISWRSMLQRCYDKNHRAYAFYGGRGITVCERWLIFANFFKDMGERPAGTTLDRRDADGNYESQNVRWATVEEQNNHLRSCHYVEYGGDRLSIANWARRFNVPYATLYRHLVRNQLPLASVAGAKSGNAVAGRR